MAAASARASPSSRILRSPAAAWAVCVATTAWICAPLLRGDFRVGDTAFTLLWMRHLGHFGSWTEGPAARPMLRSIAQNDWVLGEGLLLRLFEWLGPWNGHDAVVTLGLLLTTLMYQRLSAALYGEGPHTWIAAALGGLNPLQTVHAPHANLVHHEWMALAALLVGAGGVQRRPWLCVAGGAATAASFHFGLYIGMHTTLVFGFALLVGTPRTALAALAGAGTVGLTVAPVLLLYHDASVDWGASISLAERVRESWRMADTLLPSPAAPLHALLPTSSQIPPNPGYVALLLGAVGMLGGPSRPHRVLVALVLTSLALAIGPTLVVGGASIPFLDRLLPLGQTREPARWLVVAFGGLGLLAAHALRSHPRLAALLMVPVALELARIRPASALPLLPAIYAAVPPGPAVLYDAALVQQRSCGCGTIHALSGAWIHAHPLLAGVYARPTREGRSLTRTAARWPDDAALELFTRAEVAYVVEHPPLSPRTRGDCTLIADHRLCHLPRG